MLKTALQETLQETHHFSAEFDPARTPNFSPQLCSGEGLVAGARLTQIQEVAGSGKSCQKSS
jgi:hypothetical protein